MQKFSHLLIGVVFLLTLSFMGCRPQFEKPSEPIFEGRSNQWLTDGIVGIMAIDFSESFSTGSLSLGMKYRIANFGTSQLNFDAVRVEFQVTPIGDDSVFITTTDSMSVITDNGLTTFFNSSFENDTDVSKIMTESFILSPSAYMELDVNGTGTPIQLVSGDSDPHRDYKIFVTLYTGGNVAHGPFTISVTALEDAKGDIVFE